jgi:hypothetical protein
MSDDRHEDLDELIGHIWSYIEEGARSRAGEHPFATPTFATSGPDVRTVALRRASADERMLLFHADARSDKIDQLRDDSTATWHLWDPQLRQQLRIHGSAILHAHDELADSVWEGASDDEKKLYLKAHAPGTELDAPSDGLGFDPDEDFDEARLAEGRQHFVVIRTVVERIEWLHLHPEGHYRAQFDYDLGEDDWEGAWLVP